ncbi:unnamed protein product, partial [Ceratitis capitata]
MASGYIKLGRFGSGTGTASFLHLAQTECATAGSAGGACMYITNPYPKEVTIHNEESEVRINSLLDEETSWFNSRVKCFPLYSLMLACNRVEYDLLSLGVHGHELEVISIHLTDDIARGYVQELTKFLAGKSYKLQKTFGRNYFYQRSKRLVEHEKKIYYYSKRLNLLLKQ